MWSPVSEVGQARHEVVPEPFLLHLVQVLVARALVLLDDLLEPLLQRPPVDVREDILVLRSGVRI